jgi:hypothetical protein
MKKAFIIAAFLIVAIAFSSCATLGTTNGGVPQKTVPILGFVSGKLAPQGEEIASFVNFYGICIGYDDFVEKVKGKNYDVLIKNYYLFIKVSAIAK